MALLDDLKMQADRPYGGKRVEFQVIAQKTSTKVTKWNFSQSIPTAVERKQNKNIVICDGKAVSSVLLFEDMADKFHKGKSYAVLNYGVHRNRIVLHNKIKIFNVAPIEVSAELMKAGEALLFPPEVMLGFDDNPDTGIVSLVGKIKKISKARQEQSTKLPIRELIVEQGGRTIPVTLWRDAVLLQMNEGDHVKITHLKVSQYKGLTLASTAHTTATDAPTTVRDLVVSGTSEETEGGDYMVLTQSSEVFVVEDAIWFAVRGKTNFKIKANILQDRISSFQILDEEHPELLQDDILLADWDN